MTIFIIAEHWWRLWRRSWLSAGAARSTQDAQQFQIQYYKQRRPWSLQPGLSQSGRGNILHKFYKKEDKKAGSESSVCSFYCSKILLCIFFTIFCTPVQYFAIVHLYCTLQVYTYAVLCKCTELFSCKIFSPCPRLSPPASTISAGRRSQSPNITRKTSKGLEKYLRKL